MNKILITQHFSRNKGNVSLLYTLVEAIRENIPEAEVTVSSYNPVETNKLFGYVCCEWPFITRNVIEKKGLARYCAMAKEIVIILLQIAVAYLIRIKLINHKKLNGRLYFLNVLNSSDKIISPGGHLFTSFNQLGAVFAHFYPALLSKILKKDFYILAQTIGPFFGIWRFLTIKITKFVIKNSIYTSVRDEYSLDNLSKIGVPLNNINKTNELVFLFPESSMIKKNKGFISERIVGITIHHIYYKYFMSKEEYIKETVNFVEKILNLGFFKVKLISMESNFKDKGDHLLLKEIKSRISSNSSIHIDYISMDPREVLNVFSNLSVLVATKTHSVVYGLRQNIPTLAIAYDNKTSCFMKDFGLQNYCIPMEEFNSDNAFRVFQELVKNHNLIQETIKMNLSLIQKQALENIHVLKA